jgi:putative nucleotidyltransferase with HDIG domain
MTSRHMVRKITWGGVEWWQHTMNRMVRCRTVPALLDLAYDAVRGGLGYDHVAILLVDPARRLVAAHLATDEDGHRVSLTSHAVSLDAYYSSLLADSRMGAEGPGFLFHADVIANEPQCGTGACDERPTSPDTLFVALRTPETVLGFVSVANNTQSRGVTAADAPPLVALAIAFAPALQTMISRQRSYHLVDDHDKRVDTYVSAREAPPIRRSWRAPHTAGLLLEDRHLGVLNGFVAAINAKDRYTREHSEDVTRWALLLAETTGVSLEQRRVLALAGLLHDVGKVAIPDHILCKPGKLTRDEHEIMKHHVSFGVSIIRGVLHDARVIEAVAHHHERWDGQGYPYGLVGTQSSLPGRIMQVADAASAMRLNRPYRQGLAWSHVIAELRAGMGTQFDPALVEPFISAVGRLGD